MLVHVLDAGHFAFDKAVVEMAGLIRTFADMNATKSLGITPAP